MPLEDSPVDVSGPQPDGPPEGLDPRELLQVLLKVRQGDFSARLPTDLVGVPGKIADTLNDVVYLNELLLSEVRRLRREVGREGRTHQRASLPGADGGWRECV